MNDTRWKPKQTIWHNRYLIDPYKSNGTNKKSWKKIIIIICQFCWLGIGNELTTHPTQTKKKHKLQRREAGFSSLSFQEKPTAQYSKFFQASIGKHLNKTNKQTTYARSHEAVNRSDQDPPPASALGRLDVRSGEDPRSYHPEKKTKENQS